MAKKTILWRGYHGDEIRRLIRDIWKKNDLLILLPPSIGVPQYLTNLDVSKFPEDPVLGLFSTGSEKQKLILYSKKNIVSSLEAILGLFDKHRMRQIFCYPQPFHTFGLLLGYVQALLYERELVISEGPYSTVAHEKRARMPGSDVLTLGTPTHFRDLIASGRALSPSYSCIIGAARVEKKLWHDVRDKLKVEMPSIGYGATEASPGISHLPPGREPKEDGEIGFPLNNADVKLDEMGLTLRGPSVCIAIVDESGIEFPKSITIRDRVDRREDGVMVYRGRLDNVLNRGGEKFQLERMETELPEGVVCLSIPDERLGEELAVVATSDCKDEVFGALLRKYGREFNPKKFVTVERLPVNSSGKVDRNILRNLFRALPVPVEKLAAYVPHRPPMVWVDEVVECTESSGTCRVKLDPRGLYFSEGRVRESSFIEWMAQSFAYVEAYRSYSKGISGSVSEAFLVGMRDIEIRNSDVGSEASLRVKVRTQKQFENLVLFQAEVVRETGELLARGTLKVYAKA